MEPQHAVAEIAKKAVYSKICYFCHKPYLSSSRHQRFGSGPEHIHKDGKTCCQRYQDSRRSRKRAYVAKAEQLRIKVMAHDLAVRVMAEEVKAGRQTGKCVYEESYDGTAVVCKAEKVQIHHRDMNWLNNTPANLACLCDKHHRIDHSNQAKGQPTQQTLDKNEQSILPDWAQI